MFIVAQQRVWDCDLRFWLRAEKWQISAEQDLMFLCWIRDTPEEVWRQPESGEPPAGRWTFQPFTPNRKQTSRCWSIEPWGISLLSSKEYPDILGNFSFRCLHVSWIDISFICLHSERYWLRIFLARSVCTRAQQAEAGGSGKEKTALPTTREQTKQPQGHVQIAWPPQLMEMPTCHRWWNVQF